MKNYIFLLFGFLFFSPLFAQQDICDELYLFKEGYYMKQAEFNSKGKQTGTSEFRVLDIVKQNGAVISTVQMKIDDGKKKSEPMEYEVEYQCKDQTLYIDLTSFGVEMLQGMNTAEIRIDGEGMAYPSNLSEGMSLPDVSQTIDIIMEGMGMMKTTMTAYDRKVLGKEKVTTPAGTFECFKITNTFTIKMVVSSTFTTITYFNQEMGSVKSEFYNRNGKLKSYSEIIEFSK